jgi:hypothetical protein
MMTLCGQCPRQTVTIVHVTRARHQGHTWGHVVGRNGQRFRVWSTPKDADVAARMIRRFVLSNREG